MKKIEEEFLKELETPRDDQKSFEDIKDKINVEKFRQKKQKPKKMLYRVLGLVAAFVFLIAISVPSALYFGRSPAGNGGNQLGRPPVVTALSYEERKKASYDDLKASAELFASQFTAAVQRDKAGENFAVSPLSVYMALAMCAECTAGETRSELLSALNVTYPVLEGQFATFYRGVIAEYKGYGGEVAGRIDLTNSIWVDKSLQTKQACIDALAQKYLCYSYSADFFYENEKANKAIQKFVKEQTHGLINQNFQLEKETLFALINTLYLKDMWRENGDLSFTQDKYDFTQSDGTTQSLNLLQGGYGRGRVCEAKTFTHFYTTTYHGCKLKFILPKEGYGIDEVFTEENIAAVNALADYKAVDEKNKIRYYTRCLFPEFNASYDKDVKELLQSEFGVKTFFTEKCNFSTLTDTAALCTKVQHVTKLKVDKKGIEGAAVTIGVAGPTSAGPDEYTEVYDDFVVDGAFGFILTDRYDNTLFSGVINQLS